jgi:hypothetical protein
MTALWEDWDGDNMDKRRGSCMTSKLFLTTALLAVTASFTFDQSPALSQTSAPDRVRLGSPLAQGVMIAEVPPGTLTEQLGLKAGDLIYGINEVTIVSLADLTRALGAITPGAEIRISYARYNPATRKVETYGARGMTRAATAQPRPIEPGKGAPAQTDKDAEIEELKRRLSEMQGQPAPAAKPPVVARPNATPVPAATANRVVPSKFPATPKRPGYVTGRVLTSAGQPLVGADISITGISGSGGNAKFATKSGAGGLFSLPVPNGIYRVVADWKTRYNDHNYKFDLHPVDGIDTVAHRSAPGIVKDFRLQISGLRPGQEAGKPNTFGESTKYYGGHISVSAHRQYGTPTGFVYFPQGSTLVMTLTPRTKLIDGSTGSIRTYRHTLPSNVTYYEYLSWYIDDIPIGLYTVTVEMVGVDGKVQVVPVKLTKNVNDTFTPSVPLDFEPGQFDNMQSMSITINSPLLP